MCYGVHMAWTKLFSSIIASTIWREDDKTRLVWVTMLALADRNGLVSASVPGLAVLANVSLKECEAALAKLSAPDVYSRTKTSEGRRIAEADGGFQLLNHSKYREMGRSDERRPYFAERQRRIRADVKKDSKAELDDTKRLARLAALESKSDG